MNGLFSFVRNKRKRRRLCDFQKKEEEAGELRRHRTHKRHRPSLDPVRGQDNELGRCPYMYRPNSQPMRKAQRTMHQEKRRRTCDGEEQRPLFFVEVEAKRIHDALPIPV